MSRYPRGFIKDSDNDFKKIEELPTSDGQLEKKDLSTDKVATKHLIIREYRHDLYGLCCYRVCPALLTDNELSPQENLDSLSIVAKDREERINTVTRVLHLATANMTGLITTVPQRMQVLHHARPDASNEIESLEERIKGLECCWTGLICAVQSISTSLCNFGSRLSSPCLEDPQIPDYFLRITRKFELGKENSHYTYFDDIVGFACADYKYVKTTNPQDFLPLGQTPYNTESHKIQREMFSKHMNNHDCPSSFISVEQNPYRINNILKLFVGVEISIAVIDTRKMRKMGIHFERTKVIQDSLGFLPRETKGNNTHWLVEYWIPAETFNMVSIETFKEVFQMFDPRYETRTRKDTIPHDIQCRYDDKEGFVIYDPTDITARMGSMKI